VISGFKFAVGPVLGVGLVVKTAICQGSAEALVEEQEQESDVDTFSREAVGIASTVALDKAMTFELAEVVAELVESVSFGGKLEGGDRSLVDLLGDPAANAVASMREKLPASG